MGDIVARRTWFKDTKEGKPICYRGRYNDCYAPHLAFSELQSEDLQQATEQINLILDDLSARHPDVAIIDAGGVLLLLEVESADGERPQDGSVRAQDEAEAIWSALEIRDAGDTA